MARLNSDAARCFRSGLFSLAAVLLAGSSVLAQPAPGAFALVNGQPLSDDSLALSVQASVANGQADSAQLREALKAELIAREVLAQEARKLKLDEAPLARAQWAQAQQNFLANLLLADFANRQTITPQQVQAEYDALVKNLAGAKQYKLSLIVVPSEARAREIIAELGKSKDTKLFARLAAAESIDATKTNQGSLDWLLAEQMLPAIGNVVVNLSKGRVAAAPIQTRTGWNVVRLDDTRDFVAPSLKDVDTQLRQAIAQRRVSAYIQQLQEQAKVQR